MTLAKGTEAGSPINASNTRQCRAGSLVIVPRCGPRGLGRHTDETYTSAGGKWRYIWAVDRNGKVIGFRLTALRDARAARALFRQARDTEGVYRPVPGTTDKAPPYARMIGDDERLGVPLRNR